MSDILTMIRKEFLELRFSLKYLFVLVGLFGLPLLVLHDNSRSLVSIDILPKAMIILTGFLGSQVVFDSILGEKKAKTLEMLLSTRLASYAIVMGKAAPGVVFGCVLSALSYLLFLVLPVITHVALQASMTPLLLLFVLPLSYLAACDCIVTTLLIPDEKASPLVGLASMIALLFLGWKMFEFLLPRLGMDASIAMMVLSLLLLCVASTAIASVLLRKVQLYTKP